MAHTKVTKTGTQNTGTANTFSYSGSFDVFKASEVEVELDNIALTFTTSTINESASPREYTVDFNNKTVHVGGANLTSSDSVIIQPVTDMGDPTPRATYTAGASITSQDLNNNQLQVMRKAMEYNEQKLSSRGGTMTGNLHMGQNVDLTFEGDTDNTYETTLTVTDPTADRTITLPDTTGTVITTGDSGTVTSTMINNGTILNADINASANIDNSKIADGLLKSGITVNSANIVNGSIVNDDINNSAAIAGSKISPDFGSQNIATTGTVDGRDVSVDGTKLDGIETNAKDDQTAAEIKTLLQSDKITDSEIATGTLDNRYFTETESDARYFRQDSSETISSGNTWSNSDAFVATTAAINARIVDLIDDVGGFTAITSEQHFPDTNPQGSTGQAAILSIQSASTTLTPSGTTVTISNGNLANNANIIITGVTATIPSGFGFLVESTSTLHTYAFHRLVPNATQVTTVANNITNIVNAGANVTDINNFADLYIISGSQPSNRNDGSSLQEGDLWYDSSNDNLLVYTGSAFSVITPSQSVLDDVAIVSGAITYSEDLGLITDAASTGSSNGSLDIVADALEDEVTFTVTAATGKFIIDGVDKPALTLYKGWTYTFDVSDASNASHPLRFQSGGNNYSTNVTVTGTQGQAGAKVSIKIPESQPTSFQYYCTAHSGMGNTITVKDDPIKTVSDNISSINTVSTNISNVNTVNNSISNVNTVGASIGDVNRYANEYIISGTAPSSPSPGDLWFDTSNNVLKNYNGTIWAGITSNSGIASVVDDTSPQLGGALDGQNNNMSNIGTIDGANLQLDFGTL